MSHEAAARFLEAVHADVVDRARQAADPAAALVEAGADAGYEFTVQELRDVAATAKQPTELSDERLGQVAGGLPDIDPVAMVSLPNAGGPVAIMQAGLDAAGMVV